VGTNDTNSKTTFDHGHKRAGRVLRQIIPLVEHPHTATPVSSKPTDAAHQKFFLVASKYRRQTGAAPRPNLRVRIKQKVEKISV
jgi:hypothetical protein